MKLCPDSGLNVTRIALAAIDDHLMTTERGYEARGRGPTPCWSAEMSVAAARISNNCSAVFREVVCVSWGSIRD